MNDVKEQQPQYAEGDVRYERTRSVGEVYESETIEGSPEDVLKVLRAHQHLLQPTTLAVPDVLTHVSTKMLHEQLASREGIRELVIAPGMKLMLSYGLSTLEIEGPARILINQD